MANRIQLRRGSAQEWQNVNPTLAIGELGIEIDTGRIKIGDGVTPWNSLRYERPTEAVTNTANTLVQRDADGNFQAGFITASVIGNASTATRLANVRQVSLTGELSGSATFDGSSNLNISSTLALVPSLPHYDSTTGAQGTYTKVVVDSKGRVINASNPTSISDYGLDGTVEGSSAQPYDRDLLGIADLSTTGHIVRVSDGNIVTRTVTGTAGRISVVNGSGVAGNPTLDLINTTIVPATYNTPTIAGATQTLNATRFTVDQWGRFTYAEDFPIATAVEGTTASGWTTGTTYARYDKVTNDGRLYQSLNGGTSGVTNPVHTTGDASDGTITWRHLGLVSTRQKGLASFDQEDFDVDSNGHVTISLASVDNTQLQNNQIRFADGNTFTAYELDNELTASTGYRGITTINDLSVNTTGGSPLLKCLAADDNLDVNTVGSTIFSDITLDKTLTTIQTIQRAGSLTLLMNANTTINRFLRLTANNAGTGEAKMEIVADDSILVESSNSTISITSPQQISLISSSSDVRVEDFYFANNVLSSTNSTIVIDPAGIGDNTGTLQIKGNLQVDGITTTVNSTTITIDDVIVTLGGDQTPTTDDNKDRGIEFKYYDTQARLGFYGWDDSYATLAGTTGGYRFLYNATNTSEVFSGTDAGLVAGNLALTTNTNSISTTTGTLVVTGGTGISGNLWIGGNTNIASNTTLQGTLGVTDNVTLNKNVTIVGSDTAATELFKIQNASAVDKFVVDSSSGNTTIEGTLGVTNATTLSSSLGVTGITTLTGDLNTQSASTVNIQNVTNTNVLDAIAGVEYASLVTYGALKVDGGASIANGLVVGGSLKIYGQFDVDGAVSYSGNTIFKGNISVDNDGSSPFKFNVASSSGRLDTIGQLVTSNTTDSSSTTTGSIITSGGVGIAKQLRVAGVTRLSNTTDSSTTTNGALIVTGGAGIAKQLRVGGNATITGATQINSTLGVTGVTSITNSTNSTATNNGALVVSGGVGIGNQLRVVGNTTLTADLAVNGGDLTTNKATFNLLASPTTVNIAAAGTTVNIAATTGTTTIRNNLTIGGNLTVSGSTVTVNSTVTTIKDPIITLGGSNAGGAASSDDNKDRGIEFKYFDLSAKTGFFGWDDSSSAYRFLENATNSSEVFSGTDAGLLAGSLTLSKSGTALTVNNNASIGGTLGVTNATTLSSTLNVTSTTTLGSTTNVLGSFYIKTGTTTKFQVGNTTGNTDIAGTLTVASTTQLNSTLGVTGVTSLTNSTNATTTGASFASSGAVRITGGAAVAGNFVIGGNLRVFGDQVVDGGVNYVGTQQYSGRIVSSSTAEAVSATNTAASISTQGGVAIAKKLFVGNNTSVGGTLDVTGITTITGLVNANSGAKCKNVRVGITAVNQIDTIVGDLILDSTGGTVSINDACTISGILTASAGGDAVLTARDARRWTTNRTLSYTGDATGSMSVNGSGNVSAALTLATVASAGTYRSVTVNAKGLVTSGTNPTTIAGYGLTDAQPLDSDLTAIAGLTTNGLIVRTATGAAAARSIAVSGTGISISNAAGTAGNPEISLNATSANTANTIVARNAVGNFSAGTITATLTGNASTATKFAATKNFSVTGDATAPAVAFDGSDNVSLELTLGTSGVVAGTYTKTTINAKGLVTAGSTASSDDLTEGATNLFHTNERAQDAVAVALTTNATHSGVSIAYNDTNNSINVTRSALGYGANTYSGNSSQVAYVATAGRSALDMLVIVNGLILTPTNQYNYFDQTTLSGVGGSAGESTITVSSNIGLTVGQPVAGTGLPAGASITAINGNVLTLSSALPTGSGQLRRASASVITTFSGTAVVDQSNQTYSSVSATGGSGTGLTFNVARNSLGVVTTVTVSNGGADYASGQVVLIDGTLVGGGVNDDISVQLGSTSTVTTTGTFSSIVKFVSAPSTASNNISIRYLPL